MKHIKSLLLALAALLGFSGCTSRDAGAVLADIATGYLIVQNADLGSKWKKFQDLVDEKGLGHEAVTAAAEELWDAGVKLKPVVYRQLQRTPQVIPVYSTARQTLAGVLGKPEPPDLTIEEIDQFLSLN